MNSARQLSELLATPGAHVMPGIFDGLSAKLTAAAGYKVAFMSGFAVAGTRLGMPDTGLISFTEMVDSLRNCCAAAPRIPVIGDGDTGYGNAVNAQRTVLEYARAGAAAVMIEDQVSPKKCGHTKGKQVVSREEARMRIKAAVEARRMARDLGLDILILARTDSRAVHGFDDALTRCRDFEAEGADILFLEAPTSEDEMRKFCAGVGKPCMANMVPGGKTPVLPPAELARIGYKLALYPVMLLSTAISAMQATLEALRPDSKAAMPPAVGFDDLQKIVGFPDYWDREAAYKTNE